MSTEVLERELQALKERVEALEDRVSATEENPSPAPHCVPKPRGSWRNAVGMLKDSGLSAEAFRLGAEWREQMNREGK